MDSQNYPKGENHIRAIRKEEFILYNIKGLVTNLYGIEKRLEYNDSRNDKITIDNQETLMYALIDSTKQQYDEYMRSLQLLSKPPPNPFVIPQVEIKLIVSNVSGIPYYNNSYTDISSQFVNHKDLMIRDLSNQHHISTKELENIYQEFCRVTKGRRIDGKVNKTEFTEVMSRKINNYGIIDDLFNSIDEYKSGLVDFRGFIAALSILRSSYTDRKLLLIFNAYCKTESGHLTKSDLFFLLDSNNKGKTYHELNQVVNFIFEWFDSDRDGKLNFTEFTNAYNNKYIRLDPFWTSNSFISFDEQLIPCIQCGNKVPAREIRGVPGKCDVCSSLNPSPRHFLYS
jgi:Ca2+-binding EF-hand superfamily protein